MKIADLKAAISETKDFKQLLDLEVDLTIDIDGEGIAEAISEVAKITKKQKLIRQLQTYKNCKDAIARMNNVDNWNFVPPEKYFFKHMYEYMKDPNTYSYYCQKNCDQTLADNIELVEEYKRWKGYFFWKKYKEQH